MVQKHTRGFLQSQDLQNKWWHNKEDDLGTTEPELIREGVNVALGQPSRVRLAEVWIANPRCEALVDSGATRSFILRSVTVEADLATEPLHEAVEFCVATGTPFQVRTVAQDVTYYWGRNKHAKAKGNFLEAYNPQPLILGTDCLHELKALWDLAKGLLCLSAFRPPIEVSLIERTTQGAKRGVQALTKGEEEDDKRLAEEAKRQMERDIEDLSSPAAAALVRPRRKHYKGYRTAQKRLPIKQLLKQLKKNKENYEKLGSEEVSKGDGGLMLIDLKTGPVPSPMAKRDRKSLAEIIPSPQGLLFVKVGQKLSLTRLYEDATACPALANTILRSFAKFETWLAEKGNICSELTRRTLTEFRHLSRGKLPSGLPPARVIDHTVTLQPVSLPRKGAIHRIVGEELEAQRETLQELKANK
ncbi:hypothetical protein Emag_000914 [Eimeria magna]